MTIMLRVSRLFSVISRRLKSKQRSYISIFEEKQWKRGCGSHCGFRPVLTAALLFSCQKSRNAAANAASAAARPGRRHSSGHSGSRQRTQQRLLVPVQIQIERSAVLCPAPLPTHLHWPVLLWLLFIHLVGPIYSAFITLSIYITRATVRRNHSLWIFLLMYKMCSICWTFPALALRVTATVQSDFLKCKNSNTSKCMASLKIRILSKLFESVIVEVAVAN